MNKFKTRVVYQIWLGVNAGWTKVKGAHLNHFTGWLEYRLPNGDIAGVPPDLYRIATELKPK